MLRQLSIAFLVLCSDFAFCCSCIGGTAKPCQQFYSGDAVFVGTVTELTAIRKPMKLPGKKLSYTFGYEMRFSVDEGFRGVSGTEVIVHTGSGGGDCGTPIPAGNRVLIFAYRDEKSGELSTGMCSGNRGIQSMDDPLLVELRKIKNASAVASVFGTVNFGATNVMEGEIELAGPMADTKVVLERQGAMYTGLTGKEGDYSINGIPAGTYRVRLEVPPKFSFELPYDLRKGDPDIHLRNGECREINMTSIPAGQIAGRLLASDGTPAESVTVTLLPFEVNKKLEKFDGYWDITGEGGTFEFKALPAGDYMLTVNVTEAPSEKEPFPPTYYPSAKKRDGAQPIHLKSGEQIGDLQFWLPEVLSMRSVEVEIQWEDGKPVVGRSYAFLDTSDHPGEVVGTAVTMADDNGHVRLKATGTAKFRVLAAADKGYHKEFCSEPIAVPDGPNPKVVAKLTINTDSCELWRLNHLRR